MARKPPTRLAAQDDQALLTPGPVRDKLLDSLRRQGVRTLRTNVIWGRVKQDGYGAYDELVNAARKRGLGVQMTIVGTPRYAPQMDQALSYQNADPALLRSFAGEVAGHFRGRVKRYSVWNEPNIDAFLAGASKDPRQAGRVYRNLYRAGYQGIKHADPGAQVLLGEITSAPDARAFLRSVLAGKPLKTAGLAFHPYDQPSATVAGSNTWDIDTLRPLQATLARYKRQGRLQTAKGQAAPLYLTEFGYQRGERNDAARRRAFSAAYRKAQAAGARQLLQYQLVPTARPAVPVQDGYGNVVGASRPTGWVWDTSVGDAHGNLPRLLAAAPRARAASTKRRGRR